MLCLHFVPWSNSYCTMLPYTSWPKPNADHHAHFMIKIYSWLEIAKIFLVIITLLSDVGDIHSWLRYCCSAVWHWLVWFFRRRAMARHRCQPLWWNTRHIQLYPRYSPSLARSNYVAVVLPTYPISSWDHNYLRSYLDTIHTTYDYDASTLQVSSHRVNPWWQRNNKGTTVCSKITNDGRKRKSPHC